MFKIASFTFNIDDRTVSVLNGLDHVLSFRLDPDRDLEFTPEDYFSSSMLPEISSDLGFSEIECDALVMNLKEHNYFDL